MILSSEANQVIDSIMGSETFQIDRYLQGAAEKIKALFLPFELKGDCAIIQSKILSEDQEDAVRELERLYTQAVGSE